MFDKERMIEDTKEVIRLLTGTKEPDIEIKFLNNELTVIRELVEKLVNENSKTCISFSDYNRSPKCWV